MKRLTNNKATTAAIAVAMSGAACSHSMAATSSAAKMACTVQALSTADAVDR
ncbi:hypothetical protein D3C78_1971950 [compost metagenome]